MEPAVICTDQLQADKSIQNGLNVKDTNDAMDRYEFIYYMILISVFLAGEFQ